MSRYTINEKYFDNIDTEDKAYWLGFIWCDGYVGYRKRKYSEEYSLKVDLVDSDIGHLEKMRKYLDSNHKIKIYKNGKGAYSGGRIARLYICNKYMCSNLYHKYGLTPNRNDATIVFSYIPKNLIRHFIRGVLDADGNFNKYLDKNNYTKMNVSITTYKSLSYLINKHLYDLGLAESMLKGYKRNKGRDGHSINISFSGINQAQRILDYIYKDSTVYLDRKYNKYINL